MEKLRLNKEISNEKIHPQKNTACVILVHTFVESHWC